MRGIDHHRVRRALVRLIAAASAELQVIVLEEGVDIEGEAETLRQLAVILQQGYVYGRPAFEALPTPDIGPAAAAEAA